MRALTAALPARGLEGKITTVRVTVRYEGPSFANWKEHTSIHREYAEQLREWRQLKRDAQA